jgi:hypothetical protein
MALERYEREENKVEPRRIEPPFDVLIIFSETLLVNKKAAKFNRFK